MPGGTCLKLEHKFTNTLLQFKVVQSADMVLDRKGHLRSGPSNKLLSRHQHGRLLLVVT